MGGPRVPDDRRRLLLRAALGFLQLPPIEPELVMLHRWLDTWNGNGLITMGVERLGNRLSLTHVVEDEWRATFTGRQRDRRPQQSGLQSSRRGPSVGRWPSQW